MGYTDAGLLPLTQPFCYGFTVDDTPKQCTLDGGNLDCRWSTTSAATVDVQFVGTDGAIHSYHHFQLPDHFRECQTDSLGTNTTCPDDTPTDYFSQEIAAHGGLDNPSALGQSLFANGGETQPPTLDVLNSEANQILEAEKLQAYKWDINGIRDPNTPDHATLASDADNLTGAFELLQLLAQTVAPAASLGSQALSDLLYGQDQLPTTFAGPNNIVPVFQGLANGTGTETVVQYSDLQQGRLAQLESLLNTTLAQQQTASTQASPADLPTAEAPSLAYGVLAQLATGAVLDTDTVTVTSPGNQSSVTGKAVSLQLTASSGATAPITAWSASGLPPGLSVSATTGVVTGTPTQTGTFTVTVSATDTIGASRHNTGQATFTWVITSPSADKVTVTSPGAPSSVAGKAVSLQLSATSSAGKAITSWSVTGLPAGLKLAASTGKVTGTPSKAGTFTVTATAKDSAGTTGKATFTWKVLAACGTQLIANGGFESGTSPWAMTPGVRVAGSTATPAFAGKFLARLGGRTAPRKDSLSQPVTIQPSCGAATLSYELRVISSDPKTTASDTMTVQVLSPAGKVLKTLATVSNKNTAAKYARFSFSLKPWIGQKVTIAFASSETLKGHATSFLVDNVAVAVS